MLVSFLHFPWFVPHFFTRFHPALGPLALWLLAGLAGGSRQAIGRTEEKGVRVFTSQASAYGVMGQLHSSTKGFSFCQASAQELFLIGSPPPLPSSQPKASHGAHRFLSRVLSIMFLCILSMLYKWSFIKFCLNDPIWCLLSALTDLYLIRTRIRKSPAHSCSHSLTSKHGERLSSPFSTSFPCLSSGFTEEPGTGRDSVLGHAAERESVISSLFSCFGQNPASHDKTGKDCLDRAVKKALPFTVTPGGCLFPFPQTVRHFLPVSSLWPTGVA